MYEELEQQLNAHKNTYWRTMGKVSEGLNDYLTTYCNNFRDRREIYQPVAYRYTQKRCHLIGLQFYAGYLAGGGTEHEWPEYQPLAIALELIMISAYATNQILDHKKSVWDELGGVECTLLEYHVLQKLLGDLAQGWGSDSTTDIHLRTVNYWIKDLHSNLVYGFWIEQRKLHTRYRPLAEIQSDWKVNYAQRNTLLNQVYDFAPLIGYYLARATEETGDNAVVSHKRYFTGKAPFSCAMQAINDVSDFLPNACDLGVKIYRDRFADVRNGIITYPVYELLDTPETVTALNDPGITYQEQWQTRVTELVQERKLMAKAKKQCEESWRHYVDFWHQGLGRHDLLLLSTYSMLRHNKYFASITP